MLIQFKFQLKKCKVNKIIENTSKNRSQVLATRLVGWSGWLVTLQWHFSDAQQLTFDLKAIRKLHSLCSDAKLSDNLDPTEEQRS